MTYFCDIKEERPDMYVVRFPDFPNIFSYGNSKENALVMAKEALDGNLGVSLDYFLELPDAKYRGGYPVEVDPRISFAIKLRKTRANRSQEEIARSAGMSYQQYQRLENPKKTNPTLTTICKLEKALGTSFLSF